MDEALNRTRWEEGRKCRVGSGKVLDEQPEILDGLVVAYVVIDRLRTDGSVVVSRDLDVTQLRHMKLDYLGKLGVDLALNIELLGITIERRRRAVVGV